AGGAGPLAGFVVVRLDVAGSPPVVADDTMEVVHMTGGLQGAGDLDTLFDVVAPLIQLVHVHADADAEVWAGPVADGLQYLLEESQAPFPVAAVLVLAPVGRRRNEQLQQVLVV